MIKRFVGKKCPRECLKGESVKGTHECMQQLEKDDTEILFIFLSHKIGEN